MSDKFLFSVPRSVFTDYFPKVNPTGFNAQALDFGEITSLGTEKRKKNKFPDVEILRD